ncbi:COG1361 family protein [Streptomyces albicerus]|uniref:hypothetical protein n=1 Tax=Streptomyces albicerus TaxID=2569859 RepID=UPI001788A801|nr:hypothetical protein [Streptomyces albicerus]
MFGIRDGQIWDGRRTAVVRCLLAAILAMTAVLTGPGQATAAESGPRDITQNVFYVPLHKQEPYTSDRLGLEFAYDGPARDAELAVDASGLEGVAVISSGADGCRPRMPSFTCSKPLHPDSEGWNLQELKLRPAAGVRAGDSGILRYTLKPEGLPAVRGSLTVIAGRPELRVNEGRTLKKMAVGETFGVPVVIRNTGDVPARGVVLLIDGFRDLSATTRHSNCRYPGDADYARGAAVIKCLLPDAVIAPGETMRLTPVLRMKPGKSALRENLSYGAWPFHSSGRHPGPPCCVDDPSPGLTPGNAAPLSLTPDPAGGKGTTFTTDPEPAGVDVPVRNTADIEAIGSSLLGDVGSSHRILVGYRNNGPAQTGEIRTVFVVPPGTEVTQAPYDPEAEEEMADQACETKDHGRSYTCDQHGEVGQEVTYEFTLRVTSKDTRSGCVAVSAWEGDSATVGARVTDTVRSNDKAPVQVAENGTFSCAVSKSDGSVDVPKSEGGVGGWALGTGIAALAGSALLVIRHRRRKASRSGPPKTPWWLTRFEREL